LSAGSSLPSRAVCTSAPSPSSSSTSPPTIDVDDDEEEERDSAVPIDHKSKQLSIKRLKSPGLDARYGRIQTKEGKNYLLYDRGTGGLGQNSCLLVAFFRQMQTADVKRLFSAAEMQERQVTDAIDQDSSQYREAFSKFYNKITAPEHSYKYKVIGRRSSGALNNISEYANAPNPSGLQLEARGSMMILSALGGPWHYKVISSTGELTALTDIEIYDNSNSKIYSTADTDKKTIYVFHQGDHLGGHFLEARLMQEASTVQEIDED
jgi:hypothetical protein